MQLGFSLLQLVTLAFFPFCCAPPRQHSQVSSELHSGDGQQQLHSSSFSSPAYTRRVLSAPLAHYDLIISSLVILMILHLRVSAVECLYSSGPNAVQRCDLGGKIPSGSATTSWSVVVPGVVSFVFSLLSAQALLHSCCPAPQTPSFTHVWGHPHQGQAWALGAHSEPCIETHNAPAGLTRGPFSTQQISVIKALLLIVSNLITVFLVSDDSFSQHNVMW